jgi:hypothetical protein
VPLDPADKALILKRQAAAGWNTNTAAAPRHHHRGHHATRVRPQRLGAPSESVDLLAAIQTNAQARHVLGIVATRLNQGYQAAETFPFSASHNFPGGADAKGAAIDLLNQANGYAQKVYATIPDDNAPVSPQIRQTVGIAVKNALKAVQRVSSAANNLNQGLIDDLTDYLLNRLQHALPDIPGFPKVPRSAVKVAVYAGLAVGGILALFLAAKLAHTVLLGRAQLAEAEEQAIQIAGAARRKRAARKAATIS